MKQIVIKDKKAGKMVGGIKLDNGDVILCDVGDLIKANEIGEDKEYVIIEEFHAWIDLTQEIIGN